LIINRIEAVSKLSKYTFKKVKDNILDEDYDKLWFDSVSKLSIFMNFKEYIPNEIKKKILNKNIQNEIFMDRSIKINGSTNINYKLLFENEEIIIKCNQLDKIDFEVWCLEKKTNRYCWKPLLIIDCSLKKNLLEYIYFDKKWLINEIIK